MSRRAEILLLSSRAVFLAGVILLFTSTLKAQEEVVHIPTAEEEHEQRLTQGLEMCNALEGMERTLCLANLSLAAQDGRPCEQDPSGECGKLASRVAMNDCNSEGSDGQKVLCQTSIATRYKNPDSCEIAPSSELCLGVVAAERRDLTVITERIDDPKARDLLLGTYASQTGDEEAVDHIEDNYAADAATIVARVNQAARSGRQLDNGFCWGLRGDYAEHDSYVESNESMQLVCHRIVNEVNYLNRRLATAESEEEEAAVLAELRRKIAELEADAGAGEFGNPDNPELEGARELAEAAGLPEPDEAEFNARAFRRTAEERRQACDFVGARAAAETLREELARMSESRGSRVDDPWLAIHYQTVLDEARRQELFDRAMQAAQSAYDRAMSNLEPGPLDEAERFAELARPHANVGCGELDAVGNMLSSIGSLRELIGALGEEEEEGFVDAREQSPDAAGDEVTGWERGRSVEVESESESESECDAPRPEYAAGLRSVQTAVQNQDRNALAWALAGLPSGCPGDAARLSELSDAVRELADAEAQSNVVGLQRNAARAQAAKRRTVSSWASALSTISRFVSEAEAGGTQAPSGTTSTSGTDRDTSAGCQVSIDPSIGAIGNKKGIRWYTVAQGTNRLVVSVLPIPEGQPAPRTQPGVATGGPYPTLDAARSAAQRVCSKHTAPL